jgi:undecaprenyl-diphosphatase
MELWDACVKGAVQGLAEFLPISSTAHLILYDWLVEHFGLRATHMTPGQEEALDILLHLGTLGAIILYYRKPWAQVLQQLPTLWQPSRQDTFQSPQGEGFVTGPFLRAILVSFFTTSLLAMGVIKASEVFFKGAYWKAHHVQDLSEFYLAHPQFVVLHLAITGVLLLVADWLFKRREAHELRASNYSRQGQAFLPPYSMPWQQGFWVGFFQACSAIFHGISRSGSTMTAGLITGFNRKQAAHYSFMLSAPIYLAVALYGALKLSKLPEAIPASDWLVFGAGTLVSFAVGYICIQGFLSLVGRMGLWPFAVYCWVVCGVLLSLGIAKPI